MKYAIILSSILIANPVFAQQFGESGIVIISAERMFGFSFTRTTWSDYSGDETGRNNLSLGLLGTVSRMPLNIPRLGFDVAILDGLTLGANLSYAFDNSSDDDSYDDDSGGSTEYDVFLIGPRLGWATISDNGAGVWLRMGFTYIDEIYETGSDYGFSRGSSTDNFVLTMEALYLWSPVDRFVLTPGLVVDIPLGGSSEPVESSEYYEGDSTDVSILHIGFLIGFSAYF